MTFAISDPAVSPVLGVLCLGIGTTNSKGTMKSYGPFGVQPCYGRMYVEGVIYGLYDRVGNDSIMLLVSIPKILTNIE